MLRRYTNKIALILVGFGVLLMSLSLKVRHFDGQHLLVEYFEFESTSVPDHWVDYFLQELAETGEDLPGKNIQLRDAKSDLRKKNTSVAKNETPPNKLSAKFSFISPPRPILPTSAIIPDQGYYASLALLHLF